MNIPTAITTNTAKETQEIGEKAVREFAHERIFCLYGELGSGKTTFVQGFAKGLGLPARLLSPTFIIVRRYSIPRSIQMLYHIDLYRIKKMAELANLGLSEILTDPTNLVIIEWADRLGSMLPKKRIDIRFSEIAEDVRNIKLLRYGR